MSEIKKQSAEEVHTPENIEDSVSLKGLCNLLYSYSQVHRFSVTRERLDLHRVTPESADYMDEKLREPLTEHVGVLPIIATYLYPHLQNRDEVDLGNALIILSIHDILETERGDLPRLFKRPEELEEELVLTVSMIDIKFHEPLLDMEKTRTPTGKFAKCVDMMAPLINDLLLPVWATNGRLAIRNFDTEKMRQLNRKYFEWDSVLNKLFEEIFDEYKLRREGKTDLNIDFE